MCFCDVLPPAGAGCRYRGCIVIFEGLEGQGLASMQGHFVKFQSWLSHVSEILELPGTQIYGIHCFLRIVNVGTSLQM